MFLPMLRADFSMAQEYTFIQKDKLDIPFACFAASKDSLMSPDDVKEWRQQTSKSFSFHVIEGGHFFHQQNTNEILMLIAKELGAFE